MPGPLIVAHRGSSVAVAEHTLRAYERAIADGADALECDVRLTRDHHLVCVHDRLLGRTSDGHGAVSETDLADLDRLDFARWRADLPASADSLVAPGVLRGDPGPVLRLADLLELVVDADRPVRLFVETKHPNRFAGVVEQQLATALRRYGLTEPADPDESRVVVMSFAPIGVRRMRLLVPAIPKVLLMQSLSGLRRDGSLPPGVGVAGPSIELLREHPDYVDRAHARGNRIYTWTVDAPDDVDLARQLGVDMIATNEPAAVRARLAAPDSRATDVSRVHPRGK